MQVTSIWVKIMKGIFESNYFMKMKDASLWLEIAKPLKREYFPKSQ